MIDKTSLIEQCEYKLPKQLDLFIDDVFMVDIINESLISRVKLGNDN